MKDNTDRNRTSPFAFTGNKFEFRMLGSSASVATPNIILNTAVAEALSQFAKELEGTAPEDMEHAVHELIKRAIKKHKKVIFNGNGYTEEWVEEAKKRGLYNLESTPDCLPQFISDKNVELFTKHHIFTKEEIFSRYEILLENYVKTIGIEAKTMKEMLTKDFLPAVSSYAASVSDNALAMKALAPSVPTASAESLVSSLGDAYEKISSALSTLDEEIQEIDKKGSMQESADYCHKTVLATMDELRAAADEAEAKIPDEELPYPTYDALLFSV
jgi:glutamine synthetase